MYGFVELDNLDYMCAYLDVDMLASTGDEEETMRKRAALQTLGISAVESFVIRSSYNEQDVYNLKRLWASLIISETSSSQLEKIQGGFSSIVDVAAELNDTNVLSRLRRVRRLNDAIESRLNKMVEIELTDGWRLKLHTPSVLIAILLRDELSALRAFDSALRTIWWDVVLYEFIPFALPYFVVMNLALIVVYYRVRISNLLRLSSSLPSGKKKRSNKMKLKNVGRRKKFH